MRLEPKPGSMHTRPGSWWPAGYGDIRERIQRTGRLDTAVHDLFESDSDDSFKAFLRHHRNAANIGDEDWQNYNYEGSPLGGARLASLKTSKAVREQLAWEEERRQRQWLQHQQADKEWHEAELARAKERAARERAARAAHEAAVQAERERRARQIETDKEAARAFWGARNPAYLDCEYRSIRIIRETTGGGVLLLPGHGYWLPQEVFDEVRVAAD